MSKAIYILSDRRPGHVNQSRGLLLPLGSQNTPIALTELPVPRHALKHVCLVLAGFFFWAPAILRRLYSLYYGALPPRMTDAALLVSTGGDTLVANIILARLLGIPNVFVGKRSYHTDHGIRLLVTTTGKPVKDKVVVTDFAPVNIHPSEKPQISGNPMLIAVLLGGDSNEYHYTEQDFALLATSLNALCQRSGARLLLTTSRRTGAHGDRILRERMDARILEEATWYSENPAPTAGDYCSRADIIFCSEDSGTMLTESISYGKPVVSFFPQHKDIPPFYAGFLGKMRDYHVTASNIPGLADLALDSLPKARTPDLGTVTNTIKALLN